MRKIPLLIIATFFLHFLNAQKSIDSAYIASKTSYFQVKNRLIIGDGSSLLKAMINQSQFVVFGERHNSLETSRLISALIPILDQFNYQNIALEIGPQSAKKLRELSKNANETVKNLKQFNTKYARPLLARYPIPFFTGTEDAEFLAKMATSNMNIWGLDQEYYYSILFLTDGILKLEKYHPNFSEFQIKKEKVDKVIKRWFFKEVRSKKEKDIFSRIVKEPRVVDFFDNCQHPASIQIIKDLKLSWDIYSRWKKGSHLDRISYMRNNFLQNYNGLKSKTSNPKVFIKVGQAHASKIISNRAYDLGHLANELAAKNGTNCTNINTWTRFYINKKGKSVDYANQNFYHRIKQFIIFGKKDQWAIIDFKSIRKDIATGKVALPSTGNFHTLNSLIQGYDYQLILPEDRRVTLNISK